MNQNLCSNRIPNLKLLVVKIQKAMGYKVNNSRGKSFTLQQNQIYYRDTLNLTVTDKILTYSNISWSYVLHRKSRNTYYYFVEILLLQKRKIITHPLEITLGLCTFMSLVYVGNQLAIEYKMKSKARINLNESSLICFARVHKA